MSEKNKHGFHKHLYVCLGQIVSGRRKRLGLSQEELAAESHVDRAFISKLELAQRKPSFGLVSNVAQGLRMRYSRLVHNCEQCVEAQKERTSKSA